MRAATGEINAGHPTARGGASKGGLPTVCGLAVERAASSREETIEVCRSSLDRAVGISLNL